MRDFGPAQSRETAHSHVVPLNALIDGSWATSLFVFTFTLMQDVFFTARHAFARSISASHKHHRHEPAFNQHTQFVTCSWSEIW